MRSVTRGAGSSVHAQCKRISGLATLPVPFTKRCHPNQPDAEYEQSLQLFLKCEFDWIASNSAPRGCPMELNPRGHLKARSGHARRCASQHAPVASFTTGRRCCRVHRASSKVRSSEVARGSATCGGRRRITRLDPAVVAALCRFVRESQILLVLDNCEHMTTAVAACLGQILDEAPGVHALITSRAALRCVCAVSRCTSYLDWRRPRNRPG
jgi:hypothetical protein